MPIMTKKTVLNENQRKAIEYPNGSVLVVAGAGTGKTRVITQRIKHLVKEKNINPKQILALTFTEKAAAEMLERLDDVMPLGYEEPWVSTFHSFADRILKLEGLEVGLDPTYKIISGPDQWLLLRKNLFKLNLKYFRPLGNPTKFISALLTFVSRLQDENITVAEFTDFAQKFDGEALEKERWLELAGLYSSYQEIKIRDSKLDFGDLILWCLALFKTRPNILKKYQEQFRHVLVDEFQDTNYAQYELIKMLFPASEKSDRSLLVVGDDSQSIYKFRGAAVSNILDFMRDYPSAEMITLLQNYRSSQIILDSSYELIKNNNPDSLESTLGISKKLISEATATQTNISLVQATTLEDEVEYVVSEILQILAKEPTLTYKDIAILSRANSHLDPFILALRKYGLPYQLVGNRGLYDRDEIRDVIALLRVVINPEDSVSLFRVLNISSLGIPIELITGTLAQARTQKVNMWELIKNSKDQDFQAFCSKLRRWQTLLAKDAPSEFVYRIVTDISYIKSFLQNETVESHLCIKNLDLFLQKVKKFEVSYKSDTNEIANITDFIEYLDLVLEAGENPAQAEIEDIDTINLLTVHASKGLEFPVVFMVNLVSDRFPTRNRKDVIELPEEIIKETLPSGDAHIQEERRLFYVGMTRAKNYLYMTLGKNYGGKRDKTPSGYIFETGLELVELDEASLLNQQKRDQIGLFGLESGFRDPKIQSSTTFVPNFLSFSQIDTYKSCPLQYKYKYVLGIPVAPNHALSYGITIHDTLRDFHKALAFGEKVDLTKLLEMYNKNWQPTGYLDAEHRALRFEDGKRLLSEYFEKNKDYDAKHVALEKSFNIKIAGIKFYGKIDRIDRLPDGRVEIIDYKTGTTKDQKDVDKDSQVAYYALAAQEALGLNPDVLTYYFLESGDKISTTRTKKQLDEIKTETAEIIDQMKEGKFIATPGMHCSWCDYKDICPFAQKS